MTEARGDDALPEGEERPPPGTRTMAIARWGLVVLMAVAAAGAWVYFAADWGVVRAESRYQCPMHPQIVTTHRGECPICGMNLVPVKAGAAPALQVAVASAAASPGPGPGAASRAAAEYTCPMHPAFVTADPRVRCPECGMKVVPRAPAGASPVHALADPAPAGPSPGGPPAGAVPGLAPVELTADRIQLSGVRTAPATREPLATSIRTAGFVAADETRLVSVTVRYSGWIESLGKAQTGQLVAKGEVLASVYSPEIVTAEQGFLNVIRWSAGSPGGPLPGNPSDLERDARARLDVLGVAQEDVDAIAKSGKVPRTVNVRAPAAGHITRRSAIQGLYVTPGAELFQIADLSRVWVLADVYESEIGRVKVGQRAVFETSAWPGERFAGRVTFVYPAVNTGTRTLQARLELRNPGLKLRPGLHGDVSLDMGAREAVTVPREALVDTGDVQYVFVAKERGRFEPRRVRVGWAGTDRVAILEGVAEGERVVTTAGFLVDSESRLRAAIEGFGGAGGDAPAR